MKKFIIPLVMVAVAAMVFAGCMPAAAPPTAPPAAPPEVAPPPVAPPTAEPIKIGVPLSVTGALAPDHTFWEEGLTLAVEELNAKGGLLGRPVEVYTYDFVNAELEKMIAARDYLLAKDVDVFMPGYCCDPVPIVEPFAPEMVGGRVYMGYDTIEVLAKTYSANPGKYWNQMQIDDTAAWYSPHMYYLLCQELPKVYDYPNKKVAILTADLTYCKENRAGFKALIDADPEWEVVVDEMHPYGSTEFSVQLAKIREENPGLIYLAILNVAEGVAFKRQFDVDPTDSLIFVQYSLACPEFRYMLEDASIGLMGHSITVALPTKETVAFDERYAARFGEPPSSTTSYASYDTVRIYTAAVEAVGDVDDYRAIMDWIFHNPVKGFIYGPEGSNMCPICQIDRGMAGPYVPECHPGTRKGPERGSTTVLFQVQDTSDGPQLMSLYCQYLPTEEFMQTYYGYPAQGKYYEELRPVSFQAPPWIGK